MIKRTLLAVAAVGLVILPAVADDGGLNVQIAKLRADLDDARVQGAEVERELNNMLNAMPDGARTHYERWKSAQRELHEARVLLNRQQHRLDRERSEVDRLAALHQSRQAPPRRDDEPIQLASPTAPRYAPRPYTNRPTYATPVYSTYFQPGLSRYPFLFGNYGCGYPGFGRAALGRTTIRYIKPTGGTHLQIGVRY